MTSADDLHLELKELERSMQARLEEGVSFRKSNTRFDQRNEVTRLLIAACEKLWTEKATMDEANFEEHSSEIHYLCRHFQTSIDAGLAEPVYREKLLAQQPVKDSERTGPRSFFASICCRSEFPPQQGWWGEYARNLMPKFSVLRAGAIVHQCPAPELVPGDLVYLVAGQTAPADGRVLVYSEGATVDASHLTARPSDVRYCCPQTTAPTAVESRNIVLRDSNIVHGSVFCMLVRSAKTPFIPFSAYGGKEDHQFSIDIAVPPILSPSVCQGLFKALCLKAQFVCKSFRIFEVIASVRTLMILLTQELLSKGSVPKLCATAKKLGKALVLVNCDCEPSALASLAQEACLETVVFEEPKADGSEAHSGSSDPEHQQYSDISVLMGPPMMRMLSPDEASRIKAVAASLDASKGVVVVGIPQVALMQLCRTIMTPAQPMLLATGDFRFARCLSTVSYDPSRQRARMVSLSSSSGSGVLPGDTQSTSAGCSPPLPVSDPSQGGDPGRSGLGGASTPASHATSGNARPLTGIAPSQSAPDQANPDASPPPGVTPTGFEPGHFAPLNSVSETGAGSGTPVGQSAGTEVLVSLNAVGIVAEQADCVLMRPDLGCLAQALELITRRIPASRR